MEGLFPMASIRALKGKISYVRTQGTTQSHTSKQTTQQIHCKAKPRRVAASAQVRSRRKLSKRQGFYIYIAFLGGRAFQGKDFQSEDWLLCRAELDCLCLAGLGLVLMAVNSVLWVEAGLWRSLAMGSDHSHASSSLRKDKLEYVYYHSL